jgi:selenophosphate synthase
MYYFFTEVSGQVAQGVTRKVQTVSAGEIVAKTALPLPAVMDITGLPLFGVIQAHVKKYQVNLDLKREEAEKLAAKA